MTFCKILIHHSIVDAADQDFIPVYGESDEDTLLPCLDLFVRPEGVEALVEMIHVPMVETFLVYEDRVRFDARGPREAEVLLNSLWEGAELYRLLADLRDSMVHDQGILAACHRIANHLNPDSE
jgi:hypothetical protein